MRRYCKSVRCVCVCDLKRHFKGISEGLKDKTLTVALRMLLLKRVNPSDLAGIF